LQKDVDTRNVKTQTEFTLGDDIKKGQKIDQKKARSNGKSSLPVLWNVARLAVWTEIELARKRKSQVRPRLGKKKKKRDLPSHRSHRLISKAGEKKAHVQLEKGKRRKKDSTLRPRRARLARVTTATEKM